MRTIENQIGPYNSAKPTRALLVLGRNRAIKIALYISGLLGLGFVTFLIADAGAAAIFEAMLVIGWGLLLVALFHLAPMFLSNLSWRALLPEGSRPGLGVLTRIRWIRESVNSLLPVGQVGGDLVCVRLVHLNGVPAAPAVASMVADLTVGVFTQMIFVTLGLVLLVTQSVEPVVLAVVWAILAGMGIFFVLVAAFLFLQRAGMFALITRLAGGLTNGRFVSRIGAMAHEIDNATRAVYRNKKSFWTAMAWRLAGWIAGAGEVWLLMYFLGNSVSLTDALILESLGQGVRAAAFLVPGAIGVLEGSYIVFGSLFGVSPADSLALVLGKRVRELLLGLPGLVAWQVDEGRRFLYRNSKPPE